MPSPRSSTSITNPLATSSPRISTWVCGGEKIVAFSTSSASRWMTSVAEEPDNAMFSGTATCTRR